MDSGDTALGPGTTPLMRAARAGDPEVDVHASYRKAPILPRQQTGTGNDALLFAAGVGYRDKNTHGDEAGALEAVKLLLAQGLDLHYANARGETALHGAAFRGADSIVAYLVAQGARLDDKSKPGLTVLDYAMGKSITSQLPCRMKVRSR